MKNIALITGASSGIGREFARIHAAKGGDLILVARREQALNELKVELNQAHGTETMIIAQDLSQVGAAQSIYDQVVKAGHRVDILINNAGFGGQGNFHERPMASDTDMMQVNIVALTQLTKLFLPSMVARDHGRVLNVSSTASLMPGPLQAVYFATKAYVTSFSNAVFGELHKSKVTVTALLPGVTASEFAQTSGMDKTSLFDANVVPAFDVAKAGYDAMMKGELNIIYKLTFGQKMLMRMMNLMPKKMVLNQVRQMQEVKA